MNHVNVIMGRKLVMNQADAEIQDAARLAGELQREFPEMTRSAALLEAERIQRKHGLGMTLVSKSGRNTFPNTRRALLEYDATLPQRDEMMRRAMSDAEVDAWQAAEREALSKVQDAFHLDTIGTNSRSHCDHADIAFMRKCAAIDASREG